MIVRLGNFLYHYRNILFPCFYLLLFVPGPDLMADYRAAAMVGFAIALSGQLLRAATIGLDYIKRGGKNRRPYAEGLVTGGLFHHCRNPLYVGNLIILLGLGIAANSLWFTTIGMPFFMFAYGCIVAAEEDFLHGKFGADFEAYCANTGRFSFHFRHLGETLRMFSGFNWRRLIAAEYNSACLWMGGCAVAVFRNARRHETDSEGWATAALVLLAVAVLTYAVARFLKKTGRLRQVPQAARTGLQGTP